MCLFYLIDQFASFPLVISLRSYRVYRPLPSASFWCSNRDLCLCVFACLSRALLSLSVVRLCARCTNCAFVSLCVCRLGRLLNCSCHFVVVHPHRGAPSSPLPLCLRVPQGRVAMSQRQRPPPQQCIPTLSIFGDVRFLFWAAQLQHTHSSYCAGDGTLHPSILRVCLGRSMRRFPPVGSSGNLFRPGEENFDPLRISHSQLSCMHWHSTSCLQQVLAQTDLYNPRYRNFSTDNLKQVN